MRKLQRKQGARKALLKNLAKSVILHEKVITTLPKAKEVRSLLERLIEKSKKQDLASHRFLLRFLSKKVAAKVIEVLSPRYQSQKGGYIQILKIGMRQGDNAPMAIVRFKEMPDQEFFKQKDTKEKSGKIKAEKKKDKEKSAK